MSVLLRVRPSPLVHPLPIAAGLVLVVNDHILKAAAWPSAAVAGKLSDLAGLFLFPVLLTALTSRRRATAWVIATGVGFTLVKLSPGVNAAVEAAWGGNTLDPTDLACLPVLAFAWLYLQRGHAPAGALRRATTTGLIAVACAATPAPRYQRDYPFWELRGETTAVLGCAETAAWVVKSGKTGLGLTVRVHATGGACRVELTGASLRLASGTQVRGVPDQRRLELARCQVEHVYLPFQFDSEAAWNLGVRSGTLELGVATGGVAHRWRMPAEHVLRAYQRDRHAPPATTPPLSACATNEPPAAEIAK
jgi:hypothetical protein